MCTFDFHPFFFCFFEGEEDQTKHVKINFSYTFQKSTQGRSKKHIPYFFFFYCCKQAIIYDFFPYQKCKKSEVAVPEGAGGTEGIFWKK